MAEAEASPPPPEEPLVVKLEADNEAVGTQAKPPPVPGPSAPAAPVPQVALADLEKQIEGERRARNQREQQILNQNRRLAVERDQAIALAQEADRRGISTYELYTDNQISSVREQMEALAGQHETFMNEGNFKDAAQANLRMGRLGGQLALLERDKAALEQQRAMAAAAQRAPVAPARAAAPQLPTDPLERAILNRSEQTKNFLRKHPELIRSDGSLKRAAIEAHEKALDEGLAVDSDGYFGHIEKTLSAGKQTQAAPATRSEMDYGYAAPVARTGVGGSGLRSDGTFVMTPHMRQLAEEQGVTPTEWATNYVKLLKAGKITPIS